MVFVAPAAGMAKDDPGGVRIALPSGAVVVFKNEIDLWANPSLAQLPRAEKPAPLDAVLAQLGGGR